MKVALSVLTLLFTCAFGWDITPIAERSPSTLGSWRIVSPALVSEEITFKILLKQRNLDTLNRIFWEVSDPQHASYGKFLSSSEVKALIAPEPASVNRVLDWIMTAIPADSIIPFSDFIQVTTTVKKASELFTTSFFWYESVKTHHYRIRIVGPAYIPTSLTNDIDFVSGISELIREDARIEPRHHADWSTTDNPITPAVLRAYYGIPPTENANNTNNLQGIAAFSDYFSYGALDAFDLYFGLTDTVNVTRIGPDCLPDECDQYESDLDVQYITAIGSGVATNFLTYGDGEWVLDWALDLNSMDQPPLVNSISYGWSELDQCEITDGCQTYGYDSQQYVTRTDTELQSLGVQGITILVSDGDDGAPSLGGASGNCPLDPNKYCPGGGCQHTTSFCTEITFAFTSNNSMCFFPMGLGNDVCGDMISDPDWSNALGDWLEQNDLCDVEFDMDYDENPHVYSACTCDKLMNTTSFGYSVSGYVFEQSNGAVFSADYPTSSPYVTSVGATQFTWDGQNVDEEIVASILTGSIITTGGGFSSFQPQPSYQTAAVTAYVQGNSASLPPSFAFNPKMRGYPDVVFNGHNYIIFASNNTDDLDSCPCAGLTVDGTSCSSPAFAGLVSLINDQLLNHKMSPLGFLNPLLYQMAAAKPSAFNDITSGSNECNRAYCCLYGYEAVKGWDPVGGLGSPVFNTFLQYVLSVKGVRTN